MTRLRQRTGSLRRIVSHHSSIHWSWTLILLFGRHHGPSTRHTMPSHSSLKRTFWLGFGCLLLRLLLLELDGRQSAQTMIAHQDRPWSSSQRTLAATRTRPASSVAGRRALDGSPRGGGCVFRPTVQRFFLQISLVTFQRCFVFHVNVGRRHGVTAGIQLTILGGAVAAPWLGRSISAARRFLGRSGASIRLRPPAGPGPMLGLGQTIVSLFGAGAGVSIGRLGCCRRRDGRPTTFTVFGSISARQGRTSWFSRSELLGSTLTLGFFLDLIKRLCSCAPSCGCRSGRIRERPAVVAKAHEKAFWLRQWDEVRKLSNVLHIFVCRRYMNEHSVSITIIL
jgi:hypothetical protein